MKKFLIHAQNTILNENRFFSKEEQLAFQVDSDVSDIDYYISQLINGSLSERLLAIDIIFIKVGLTVNYLEYVGLRFAYHIRLTQMLGDKALIPIVLIAEETFQFLAITSDLPQILFTNGIYLMKDNPDELKKQLSSYSKSKIKPLNNFPEFLTKLKIIPPSNYQSHHSIANEWSLLSWSEILEVDLNSTSSIKKENIESILYYKYLLAKNPIHQREVPKYSNIRGIGKVLYIDDEWDKGWNLVLNKLLDKITDVNSLQTLEISFKGLNSKQVVDACSKQIKEKDPDIIILDLRLCDDDFNPTTKIEELTGCKILKFVKDYNPGIQVIIFSATNKVWNLIELQNAEADAFVLKTSPEYYLDDISNNNSITAMCDAIKKASDRKFIKTLVNICSNISSNLQKVEPFGNREYEEFIVGLKSKLKTCLSSIKMINQDKPATLDIVFISFYNFLESFNKFYIYEKKDHNFYMGVEEVDFFKYYYDNGKLRNEGAFYTQGKINRPSWSVGIKALFKDYFQINSTSYSDIKMIEDMQEIRNDYIHSTKTKFTQLEVTEIANLCKKICSNLKD